MTNQIRTGAFVDGYMAGLVAASINVPSVADAIIARRLKQVQMEFRQREKRRREFKRRLNRAKHGAVQFMHGLLPPEHPLSCQK